MKVFVFFIMMSVGLGGILGGYRAITGRDLVSLSDFGVGHAPAVVSASQPVVPQPTATAGPVAAPVPTVSAPAPVAPTAQPDKPQVMAVANTDGLGVYLRRTPKLDDKMRAWVEGTKMEIAGSTVEADGVQWQKVRAPDGTEGYIPTQFLKAAS